MILDVPDFFLPHPGSGSRTRDQKSIGSRIPATLLFPAAQKSHSSGIKSKGRPDRASPSAAPPPATWATSPPPPVPLARSFLVFSSVYCPFTVPARSFLVFPSVYCPFTVPAGSFLVFPSVYCPFTVPAFPRVPSGAVSC